MGEPRTGQPAPTEQGATPLGTTAAAIEARLNGVEQGLEELAHLSLEGLSDPERRIVDAARRRVMARVSALAQLTHLLIFS